MTVKADTYYIVYIRKDGRYEDEVISGPHYSLDKTIENVNILNIGDYDYYSYRYDIKKCEVELELEEVDEYDKRGIKRLHE